MALPTWESTMSGSSTGSPTWERTGGPSSSDEDIRLLVCRLRYQDAKMSLQRQGESSCLFSSLVPRGATSGFKYDSTWSQKWFQI